jgi:hypothetical protein
MLTDLRDGAEKIIDELARFEVAPGAGGGPINWR